MCNSQTIRYVLSVGTVNINKARQVFQWYPFAFMLASLLVTIHLSSIKKKTPFNIVQPLLTSIFSKEKAELAVGYHRGNDHISYERGKSSTQLPLNGICDRSPGGYLEDSKWLITMFSKSPNNRRVPLPNGRTSWLIFMGVAFLTIEPSRGMILQGYPISTRIPCC